MSDLHLALTALGVLVIVGILAYNRIQESAARRRTEQAFMADRADVLMASPTPPGRREPALEGALRRPTAEVRQEFEGMPDPRLDYVVELRLPASLAVAKLLEGWDGVSARFGRRALLAGTEDGEVWQRLAAGAHGVVRQARAALQLLNRQGVTGEAEVVEFRTAIETLAAGIGAEVSAPEMRQALEAARGLDRACADADIQVVVHVVAPQAPGLDRASIIAAAKALHLEFDDDDRARARDDAGNELYTVVIERTDPGEALSVMLDVPRTPSPAVVFRQMLGTARALAQALGAILQDDANRTLDDSGLASIGAELQRIEQSMERLGVAPGGPLALRLFT